MDIALNFTELAYIMDLNRTWCRQAFMKILNTDKVNSNDEISLETLCGLFEPIKSVDPRYDGMNRLIFSISMKRDQYKNELGSKSAQRYKKFTGAKTVFYKICTKEQLDHAIAVFEEKTTVIQTKLNLEL